MKMNIRSLLLVLSIVILGIIMYFTKNVTMPVLLNAGPWWIYFVMAAILASGYYAIHYTLEEKKKAGPMKAK